MTVTCLAFSGVIAEDGLDTQGLSVGPTAPIARRLVLGAQRADGKGAVQTIEHAFARPFDGVDPSTSIGTSNELPTSAMMSVGLDYSGYVSGAYEDEQPRQFSLWIAAEIDGGDHDGGGCWSVQQPASVGLSAVGRAHVCEESIMNESTFADGRLVEQIIDNGDGTGTRTTFLPDGTVDVVEELSGLPIPEPDPEPAVGLAAQVETLTAQVDALLTAQAGVDPAVMAQLVTLGATLVGSADQLQSALTAVSGSNTAKAPLQIVNAAVQAAADT